MILCFGTRPEWLKIKSLYFSSPSVKLYFTGQHKDLIDLEIDESRLITSSISNFTYSRLNNIIASVLIDFSIKSEDYNHVLVQGDTASAFACALAAFNLNKQIIYLESGLRSFNIDHPYPEEGYRQMISRIANINLCPTNLSLENLKKENILGKSFVVGNTILDNLNQIKLNSKYENHVIITLHRRENKEIMSKWINAIIEVSSKIDDVTFYFIKHPNHNYSKINSYTKNLKFINPLPHNEFIELFKNSKFVITDSGGLQEEGSFLNKKIIVCRKVTERPEGIDSGHIVMCRAPYLLKKLAIQINDNFNITNLCPYGEGDSSKRIAKIFLENDIPF